MYFLVRTFLLRHPRFKQQLKKIKTRLTPLPLLGNFILNLEKRYFTKYAKERYENEDLSEKKYFEGYANLIAKQTYGRVLDLGCGYGYLTKRVAERPEVTKVIGIDKIKDFHCLDRKITYVSSDVTKMKNLPKDFNVITATDFIEHLSEEDFLKLLPKIKNSLHKDGIFIGSTPLNPTNKKIFSITPYHQREYQPEIFKKILNKFFKNVEIKIISPDCFTWKAYGF